jgi:predicted Zn-dependent protease with MMP-like domain
LPGVAVRPYGGGVSSGHQNPPTAGEIATIARASLAALPGPFAAYLGEVVLRVEELADEATLEALGIDHPLDLTGLYEGVPIGDKASAAPGAMPDRITLYRRAILDEWVEEGEDFATLVHHIVIHEVGHHFGLDDDAIYALEEAAG